jgi:hypothetical protein
VTTALAVVVGFVLVAVIEMEPLTRQFFASLIIGLLISRLLWIFESERLCNVLLGYELDRALILRKSEKGLLDLNCCSTASKVYGGANDDAPVVGGAGEVDEAMAKELKRYRKLKNKDELSAEIERVKAEIQHGQSQLACLENMVFAVDGENDSSAQSVSRGSLSEPPLGV